MKPSMPRPVAGIKYTVAATEYTARTVWDARDAKLAAIAALADAIDAECAIANDRVADADRTAMADLIANHTPDGNI